MIPVPKPKPAFVIEVAILVPALDSRSDMGEAKRALERIHEVLPPNWLIQMREVRWS